MTIQSSLIRLLASGRGLHSSVREYGYDMLFYPAFEYYYSVELEATYPSIRALLFEFKLDVNRLSRTNAFSLDEKHKLFKVGTYIKALPYNNHFKKELEKAFSETKFHVSEDMESYFKKHRVEVFSNYTFPTYFLKSNPFGKFYNSFIRYAVDDEQSFLDTRQLNPVSFEEAINSGRRNLPNLNFIITSSDLVTLATVLSKEIDKTDISLHLAPFKQRDTIEAEMIEIINENLSELPRFIFENFFGMKIMIDTLNMFD